MIAITLGWVLIFVGISFAVGLIFGIKMGIRWVSKKKPDVDLVD